MPDVFIPAGRLNRRISILQQSSKQDAFGQPVTSWKPVLTTRAAIEIQNSQLLYSTAEFMAKATYRITVRYNPYFKISAANRISYTDRTGTHSYEVISALNTNQADRQLVLMCYSLGDAE
jgi:SPP1 family predicted phage head-tail adaptor